MGPDTAQFIRRYLSRYMACYIGGAILFGIIATIFNLEGGSFMGVVLGYTSGMLPGYAFAKDFGRNPDKAEMRRFAWLTVAAVAILSAIYGVFVLWPLLTEEERSGFTRMPVWVWVCIIVFSTVIQYFCARFGFSRGAQSNIGKISKDETAAP